MLALLALAAALVPAPAPTGAGGVAVHALEPDPLPPLTPAVLTVRGEGFAATCRVLLGPEGRLLQVPAETVDAGTIAVRLPLGLPPSPPRQLVVDCGAAGSSPPVTVHVGRARPTAAAAPLEAGPGAAAAAAPTPAVGEPPALERVDPLAVEAGRPETLTVVGRGFVDGATVRILANVNAGTSSPPRYEMRPFAAQVLSPTVLVVELDRGFSPSPRLRPLAVVNPGGAESAPLFLEVLGRAR